MNYFWEQADIEPPIRDKDTLYWIAYWTDLDHGKFKKRLAKYPEVWTKYGDGDLIAWAGPVREPYGLAAIMGSGIKESINTKEEGDEKAN